MNGFSRERVWTSLALASSDDMASFREANGLAGAALANANGIARKMPLFDAALVTVLESADFRHGINTPHVRRVDRPPRLELARNLNPGHSGVHFQLAEVLKQLNQTEAANRELEAVRLVKQRYAQTQFADTAAIANQALNAGDTQTNFDFSVFKDFAFSGEAKRKLQFRAEYFNILNPPRFQISNRTFPPQLGTLTETINDNRDIQFAPSFIWQLALSPAQARRCTLGM